MNGDSSNDGRFLMIAIVIFLNLDRLVQSWWQLVNGTEESGACTCLLLVGELKLATLTKQDTGYSP
jgi:hypothetical protein